MFEFSDDTCAGYVKLKYIYSSEERRLAGRSFDNVPPPPPFATEFRRAARLFYHLVPFYEVGEGRRGKGWREERGQGMG